MVRFAITFAIVFFDVSILFLGHCPGDEIAKGRGTASASTQVTVTVPPFLKIDFPVEPLVFRPTPEERRKGYVQLNPALSIRILTNMPSGFQVQAESSVRLECRIREQVEFLPLSEHPRLIYSAQTFQPKTELSLDVRLPLPPNAKDDVYVAALRFTALPIH